MKYAVLVLTVLAFAAPAHADGNWRNLWRNHEQRGDALLQQGDAAGAAKEYTDPARKGYAELKAGNYAAAAASLAAADDGEANYNRGNALAHAGNLPDAVKAYDAALKRDPHNQDARHNRDLLLKVMQKKPPAQPPKGAPDIKQSGKPGDEKGKDGQAGKPGQDGKQGEPKDGTQAGKQGSAAQGQDGKSGEQKDGSQAGKQGQDGKSGASKNGAQDGKPGQSGASSGKPESAQTQQGGPDEPGSSGQAQSVPPAQTQAGRNAGAQGAPDSAKPGVDKLPHGPGSSPAAQQKTQDSKSAGLREDTQARQDVAATMQEKSRAANNAGGSGATKAGGVKAHGVTPPKNEKQIAQEQWLRGIPDDPGGLLRRKFLIEHMMRQRSAQP